MRLPSAKLRRGALAVAAVAVLLLVGSGAAWEGTIPSPDRDCEKDLEYAFEACHEGAYADCAEIREDYRDACEASCVRAWCPKQVECSGHDQMWCAPCEDVHGAQFWRFFSKSTSICWQEEFRHQEERTVNTERFETCRTTKVTQFCPALNGTNWQADIKGAVPLGWPMYTHRLKQRNE